MMRDRIGLVPDTTGAIVTNVGLRRLMALRYSYNAALCATLSDLDLLETPMELRAAETRINTLRALLSGAICRSGGLLSATALLTGDDA